MWSTMRVAASGLQAQQRALDVSGNNLANLGTTGYKSRRVNQFEVPPTSAPYGTVTGGAIQLAEGAVGEGVVTGAILANFAPGSLQATGFGLDVAIGGDGFIPVTLPDGRTGYTRDGALRLDGEGRLVAGGGLLGIDVPDGVRDLAIDSSGTVTAVVGGNRQAIGQIQLARFTNPDGLLAVGGNVFVATEASGPATLGVPGENGLGALVPGHLETANVDVGDELVRVIAAQRAYSVNLRALRIADELIQEATNLRR